MQNFAGCLTIIDKCSHNFDRFNIYSISKHHLKAWSSVTEAEFTCNLVTYDSMKCSCNLIEHTFFEKKQQGMKCSCNLIAHSHLTNQGMNECTTICTSNFWLINPLTLHCLEERLWTPIEKLANDTRLVTSRLARFRCLLNQRGVAAAPLAGYGRASPAEPGPCVRQ